ncbi:hypothetical protein B0H19DRAFT_1145856 [Mycena capillaripes]|nr:hypothetical protein B0H19DRAFT_1145856 [Mycena capillaripes]
MSEYDYSEEGRRRYIATQNRIAQWVQSTESSPQLASPFSPPSNTGSGSSTQGRHLYGYPGTASHPPPAMQYGPMTHGNPHVHRHQPPSGFHPPVSGYSPSSSRSSTVLPSHSISQAPIQQMWSTKSPSTHSPHSSHSHRTHHHHRSRTAPGVIILPRRGMAPQVVFY